MELRCNTFLSGRPYSSMAEAILNPAFTSVRGRVGNIVFYSFGGRTFVRTYVIPRNPGTPSQRENRALFARAMNAWRELSAFDRESFARRSRRLGMTGHNLFISRYMIARRSELDPTRSARRIMPGGASFVLASPSSHCAGPSVSGSMGLPVGPGPAFNGILSLKGP